ncbi:MAG: hypothetical protein ABJP48_00120 [Erythrobacter sp.]
MRGSKWFLAAGMAAMTGVLAASYAGAQDAPESLLPPGFDNPRPTPTPAPTPAPTRAPPPPSSSPGATQPPPATPGSDPLPPVGPGGAIIQPFPGEGALPVVPSISNEDLASLPSLAELEAMSPDDLDELLGLKPKFDIPPAARRSLAQVGVINSAEGGLPVQSLARQPAGLVRAALQGTSGRLVSRWGHITLRRALASRLATPDGMSPVEFAALRAGLLNRLGEFPLARAIAQDVDTGNWSEELTDAALEAYVASADFVGACPAVRLQGSSREDSQWVMWQAICNAFAGESALAGSQLNRALRNEIAPSIDVLLAQRFAGAAGSGRRAVDIEWEGVDELNPWRFALANALGEPVPDALLNRAGAYYQRAAVTGAMVPLAQRASYAQRGGGEGLLSANAMVDLYSQIFADDTITGDAANLATQLRAAYVAGTPNDRLAAMQAIWGSDEASAGSAGYGRYVMTAYAAARLPVNQAFADQSGDIIASMLAAGLDRDASAWADIAPQGSLGWALIALSREQGASAALADIEQFVGNDTSANQRKSKFLVAGLGGLGRIGRGDLNAFEDQLALDLGRQSNWSRSINAAAQYRNPTLVVLLAGLGMQGVDWDQMTPRHLYNIVAALNQAGLEAEARMIAAEAVARG